MSRCALSSAPAFLQVLSSELRALRRRLGEQKRGGEGASVRAGSVDEVTVRQRQAKVRHACRD